MLHCHNTQYTPPPSCTALHLTQPLVCGPHLHKTDKVVLHEVGPPGVVPGQDMDKPGSLIMAVLDHPVHMHEGGQVNTHTYTRTHALMHTQ